MARLNIVLNKLLKLVSLGSFVPLVTAVTDTRPNILFIITDDQDLHMDTLQHMPLLQKYIINEGTTFANHFCTVALCCPSRVNLWTGRAAHNTNVTDVFPPYGGWPKVIDQGINDDWLPIWMQEAGYNTYYTGKLWNHHNVDNYDKPLVKGFNGSDFLLDPYTYQYYNAHMSRDGQPPVSYKGQYSPDLVAEKAYGFLSEALTHEEPWMLTVSPIAPHADFSFGEGGKEHISDMARYAPRHAHLFKDYRIPRTPNFNPEKFDGVSWMKNLPMLNESVIEYNDEFQRSRLRSLQSVDEMVEHLIKMLQQSAVLDNTYVIFTTDNGFHLSQHRLHAGKMCGFDTDIHIPLIIRGPGIPVGHVTEQVTAHTDLAPTIFSLIDQPLRDDFDGSAIDVHKPSSSKRHEHINIEMWGDVIGEGLFGKYGNVYNKYTGSHDLAPNNTYKGLRVLAPDYSLYYSVWCTGEKQYFDNLLDPDQIHNYFSTNSPPQDYNIAGRPFDEIITRLNALMMVLKSCKADSCRNPWKVLHPEGDVKSLVDALSTDFDSFYRDQPVVSYSSCETGYLKWAEGPQEAHDFDKADITQERYDQKVQKTFEYTGAWHEWV